MRTMILRLILTFLLAALSLAAGQQTLLVSPDEPYTTLQQALQDARDGDIIRVQGGHHKGPITIDRSLRLIGEDVPVIDGGGSGTVLTIHAEDVEIRGFRIRSSGSSLDRENSGIAVEAPRAIIEQNHLEDTLFGVYLRQAHESVVRGNRIDSQDLPLARRGDAIRVWSSHDVLIEDNIVRRGRDVVLWYSGRITVRGNKISDGRYGLHFMYCDDAIVERNRLMGNSVGAYLMYSRRLHFHHNIVTSNRGPSGYGIGLKDMDEVTVKANIVVDNRSGIFVDNSPREIGSQVSFSDNVFAYNDFGVHLLPSVQRNHYRGNTFLDNRVQVHIAGGGLLRDNNWQGNFWSDYAGYDANGDGVGDLPYVAEKLFENLMDRRPELQLFIHSPAADALDFAARAFPIVKPQPKLTDLQPLMTPHLPTGAPPPAQHSSWPLAVSALAFIGLAVTLIAANQQLATWLARTHNARSPLPPAPPATGSDARGAS